MRFVIYTAVVGSYDSVLQPTITDEEFDYVLFSNDIDCQMLGIWHIRSIPYHNPDNTRVARWVKTHPDELLSEYEASIWIDANIVILSDYIYDRTRELISQNIVISSMSHIARNCIYDEAAFVAYRGLEKETIVLNWLRKLNLESFPHHFGLYETNVIFRIHHNEIIATFDDDWWNCIEHFSRRDQLSFNYCLWKLNLDCPYFICPFQNARNSKYFRLLPHTNCSKSLINHKDIVYFFKSLPQNSPEKLGNIYERITRQKGYGFLRILVAHYYRLWCYYFHLKEFVFPKKPHIV